MRSHVIRGRLAVPLVVPLAGAVVAGLLTVPQPSEAAPARRVEVAAVRLSAEVTSYVSAVADAVAPAAARAAAATGASGAKGANWTYNPNYTVLDNIVSNLPPKIRYAILPPLYVFAAALGAVMGVGYLLAAPIINLLKPKSVSPAAAAPSAMTPASVTPSPVTPSAARAQATPVAAAATGVAAAHARPIRKAAAAPAPAASVPSLAGHASTIKRSAAPKASAKVVKRSVR